MKHLAKEHICIIYKHSQQSGDGQREGGLGAGWKWAKWGKMGTYIIVSIKIQNKKDKQKEKKIAPVFTSNFPYKYMTNMFLVIIEVQK